MELSSATSSSAIPVTLSFRDILIWVAPIPSSTHQPYFVVIVALAAWILFLLSQKQFFRESEKICTPVDSVEVTQLGEGPEVFKIKNLSPSKI